MNVREHVKTRDRQRAIREVGYKEDKGRVLLGRRLEKRTTMKVILLAIALFEALDAASVAVERPIDFKPNCWVKGDGCECEVKVGVEVTKETYSTKDLCKMSTERQTAENKKKLNEEIESKFGAFKENCFPKPSGGCKCNVDLGNGEEVKEFSDVKDCRKSVEAQTAEKKKELNEEIKEKFGSFRENCFPKPSGGCKCNEKDSQGNEVTATYDDPVKCQATARARRDAPSQNVRDPVREKAQANYEEVLKELRNKFKGLKEGCYPRPKGCLCVVGRTPEGRDITERRMKDVDCKCQEGVAAKGCPAA